MRLQKCMIQENDEHHIVIIFVFVPEFEDGNRIAELRLWYGRDVKYFISTLFHLIQDILAFSLKEE